MLLTHIGIVFYVEGYKLREIHERREKVLGFWSVIGCAMSGVTELLLGLSSCSACLTYADIVDRLEMRRQQVALAEKYPGKLNSILKRIY